MFVQKRMDSRGGSEIQSIKLAKKFSQRGHQIFFWSHNVDFEIYPELKASPQIIKLLKSHSNSKWLFSLINEIKIIKPDIVYTRDTRRLFVYTIICRLLSVPLIYNINHDVKAMPYNLSQLNNIIYRDSRAYGFFPMWAVFGYFATKCYPYLSKMVSQTNSQREFLNSKKIDSITIYNGHELPSSLTNLRSERRIIAWVGSLKKEIKRPHLFLLISKNCRHLEFGFKYCGNLTDNKSYIEYLMKTTKILGNVEYLGELSVSEVGDLLEKSYIMINTSKVESFPNTFIEAWSRGVPVISLSVDPDNIISEEGLGFKESNITGIIDKIEYLLRNADQYNDISKKARNFAIKNFDLDIIADKYISTFIKTIKDYES
tara:strand:- start:21 stop:1139 length:1119 start_codon:yes stop_codon:yes gene_type:complete